MDDAISMDDVKYAKAILTTAYGAQFANQVQISEHTITTLAEILTESGKCSDNMDLVPNPHGSLARPGLKYALKVIRKVGLEILVDPARKSYYICDLMAFRSRQASFI